MDTLSRILFILQSNNIEQKELCDFLQISNSVFSDWKSGRNKSYKKRISEIAQFLNVSADYLLGNTDTPASAEETDKKRELLNRIARMDEGQLKQLSDFADYLIDKKK